MANIPQDIQDRLNRTPEQRKAELEARRQARLDAMTPEQRQKVQEQIDRINAVQLDKQPVFVHGWRLLTVARSFQSRAAQGINLTDSLALLTAQEMEAVDWLADQIVAARTK